MSIYSHIHYDHHKILDLLYDIENLGERKTPLRKPLFRMLRAEIMILIRAEEDTFYRVLKRSPKTARLVKQLEDQKHKIENFLFKLDQTPEGQKIWFNRFSALKALVQSYIRQEEENLFPAARRVLDAGTARRLEDSLEDVKQEQWHVGMAVNPVSLTSQFVKTVRVAA